MRIFIQMIYISEKVILFVSDGDAKKETKADILNTLKQCNSALGNSVIVHTFGLGLENGNGNFSFIF